MIIVQRPSVHTFRETHINKCTLAVTHTHIHTHTHTTTHTHTDIYIQCLIYRLPIYCCQYTATNPFSTRIQNMGLTTGRPSPAADAQGLVFSLSALLTSGRGLTPKRRNTEMWRESRASHWDAGSFILGSHGGNKGLSRIEDGVGGWDRSCDAGNRLYGIIEERESSLNSRSGFADFECGHRGRIVRLCVKMTALLWADLMWEAYLPQSGGTGLLLK